tara:strand:- start:1900 stop:3021 length:1122 start_codon:yes stop_codon:yes gene_type:complete
LKRIGITGQSGFIGTHLYNHIKYKTNYEITPFEDSFFDDKNDLKKFVKSCDIIIHLAAKNRDKDPNIIYETNLSLVHKLILACEKTSSFPHIFFSSSIQENNTTLYGKSKKDGATAFSNWAKNNNSNFTNLVIPNVFGPFAKPFYNTFISTFSYQLLNNQIPEIKVDNNVDLIYVGSLCKYIVSLFHKEKSEKIKSIVVTKDISLKVSEILKLFKNFKKDYFEKGIIPHLYDINYINLFNTFRSYINHKVFFPVNLIKHEDQRGVFVEIIKLNIGGQASFSTTVPGVTRGNHFHTRKIERFTVLKGKARIQLKKVGSSDVIDFYLDGDNPSYVDMPIWYSHNIKNIGNEELITHFWINESYDEKNHDTYIKPI